MEKVAKGATRPQETKQGSRSGFQLQYPSLPGPGMIAGMTLVDEVVANVVVPVVDLDLDLGQETTAIHPTISCCCNCRGGHVLV